jgi:hypothetical protein
MRILKMRCEVSLCAMRGQGEMGERRDQRKAAPTLTGQARNEKDDMPAISWHMIFMHTP